MARGNQREKFVEIGICNADQMNRNADDDATELGNRTRRIWPAR